MAGSETPQNFVTELEQAPGAARRLSRHERVAQVWPDLPSRTGVRVTGALLDHHRAEAARLRGEAASRLLSRLLGLVKRPVPGRTDLVRGTAGAPLRLSNCG